MSQTPPECLTSDAVTLRRWRVDDASSLTEMIVSSLDHLRPWMPWVQYEPLTLDARVEKIRGWLSAWDAAEDFTFAIDDGAGGLLGVCGLHRRGEPGSLEIGYWVRSGRTGQGIATAAVRGLVQAAISIDGVTCLEIHHDAANIASARIAEKVGFTRVSERPLVRAAPGQIGIDVTWRLHRDRDEQ